MLEKHREVMTAWQAIVLELNIEPYSNEIVQFCNEWLHLRLSNVPK